MSAVTNIREFILQALEKSGPIPTSDVSSFDFIGSGHIDSLSVMKFILAIEAEYDIHFADNELLSDQFKTVSGLAELIEKKRQNVD